MADVRMMLTFTVEVTADPPDALMQTDGGTQLLAAEAMRPIRDLLMTRDEVQDVIYEKASLYVYADDDMQYLIRACPFCGSVAAVHFEQCTDEPCDDGDCDLCEEKCWRVLCDPENGGCGASLWWDETKDLAADAWNRRKEV